MQFEEIYKSTFQYVYRFFYYKSVNTGVIEDLAHDVYIRFYQKFGTRKLTEVEAKRILFGFCRNVYREWVRQSIKEKREDFLDNYDYQEDEQDYIDEFVEEESSFQKRHDAQKRAVLEAISKLNPTVRAVLEHRFINGLSRKEIAERMGIKEKDVHTYQKRGIKYLKKMVGEINF